MTDYLTANDQGVAERAELCAHVRRFLDRHGGLATTRARLGSPDWYDAALWRRLVEEFGATSIHVPVDCGGQGFTFAELSVLLAETGRVLLPSPLLSSSVMSVALLIALPAEPHRDELLGSLVSGARTATVAWLEPGGSWQSSSISMPVKLNGAGKSVLDGRKDVVLDPRADLILVVARHPGHEGLVVSAVEREQAGVECIPTPSLDETRPVCSLRLIAAHGRVVGDPDSSAGPAFDSAVSLATIGLASEMVGGARRCVEMAVSYASVRHQFGRPIGSFQAVKHLCSDMLAEVELAEAIVQEAVEAVATDSATVPTAASMAKLQASRAYRFAALEGLHVHGGIGFTREHDAHLYVRRAKASDVLFGGPRYHRAVVARSLGLADVEAGAR